MQIDPLHLPVPATLVKWAQLHVLVEIKPQTFLSFWASQGAEESKPKGILTQR